MLYPDWGSAWAEWQPNWDAYAYSQDTALYYIQQAGLHGFGAAGFSDLLNAIYQVYQAVNFTAGFTGDGFDGSYLNNLLYYSGKSTLDMDAIINAMLRADTDQLTKFVGIEDAYRSAIWLKPFNGEFYAALARGFGAGT